MHRKAITSMGVILWIAITRLFANLHLKNHSDTDLQWYDFWKVPKRLVTSLDFPFIGNAWILPLPYNSAVCNTTLTSVHDPLTINRPPRCNIKQARTRPQFAAYQHVTNGINVVPMDRRRQLYFSAVMKWAFFKEKKDGSGGLAKSARNHREQDSQHYAFPALF